MENSFSRIVSLILTIALLSVAAVAQISALQLSALSAISTMSRRVLCGGPALAASLKAAAIGA